MKLTHDEVRRIFGDISDHTIVEILSSDATTSELQEVAAYLASENDVMGELERPLTGTALAIYTMLQREEPAWDEER